MSERKFSRAGRKRQVEAGTRNLLEHLAKMDAVDTAGVERFRTDLTKELGESPSVTRRALGEALCANFASLVLLNKELKKTRHKNRLRVAEHVSWVSGNLARLLKQLNLDARARPRSLADVFPSKVAPISEIDPAIPPIPAGK